MSSLQSGVRFVALPDAQQAATLRRWIGCQRHIFSAKVEEDRLFAMQRRMMLREDAGAVIRMPLDRLYAQFKDDDLTPWLSDVPSQVLREGTYRWFNAKQRQLKGLAKPPRKRSRRDFNSVMLCSDLFEFTDDGRLILGTAKFPVGVLRFKAHRSKVAARIARKHAYKVEVLRDFAHKASLALSDSGAKLIAFEDLKVQNMTRKPRAKQDNSGRWLRNGRAAKAGLNRSILSSAWGRIRMMTQYKAARRNVLVAFVRPHHTSQECSLCGHTHPENRHGTAFVCQRCGYARHADLNAAANIAARGVALLRSGELEKQPKATKRVAVKRRINSGSVRPGVSVERLQDAAPGLAPGLRAGCCEAESPCRKAGCHDYSAEGVELR